ncbi:MAG TPA: Rne/Rng family ribonuclease [bacterium]|nr:Rne/Rng family ribonuclease [bacterium]HPQ66243.1 Rne/Rng family ribonuclease [bacterium]
MKKQILIECHPRETRVAVLAEGRLEQFFLEPGEQQSPLGNIYKGKVCSILPSLGAAFVDIGLEKNGFLSTSETVESSTLRSAFEDDDEDGNQPRKGEVARAENSSTIEKLLRKGQDLLVQVVKEPIGAKGARLSTQISLPGRFLVLMPHEKRIGVSRRIVDRGERVRLRKLMREIGFPPDMGVIVRTAGLAANKRALKRDMRYLLNAWKEIRDRERKVAAPALVHEEMDLVMKSIRDYLLTDIDRIVVDSRSEFKKISDFVGMVFPAARERIAFHKEKMPLFQKYGLSEEVEKLFLPVINLKCGGHLVFQQTEALVSIDVNTGKNRGTGDQGETILQTNLEAAEEVAKQLRLRNVGGIIVIDFIDMDSKGHQRKVMNALLKELKKDKARTRVYPFSDLGLVEMTRQREQESFLHKLYEICPCCQGQGLVKSLPSRGLELERLLMSAFSKQPRVRQFRIEAHPHLARYILEEGWENLRQLARANRIRVTIADNHDLQFGEYIVWALTRNGQEKV